MIAVSIVHPCRLISCKGFVSKQRFFQPPIDEVTRGSRETLFVTTSIRHPNWMPEPIGKLRARITTVGPDFCDGMKE